MNRTTSLPISKLIHAAVPEVETEKKWYMDCCDAHRALEQYYYVAEEPENPPDVEQCPAYTFTDVCRAIEVLGEKQGWEKDLYICVGCGVSCTTDEITPYGKHKGKYNYNIDAFTGCDSDVVLQTGGRIEVEQDNLFRALRHDNYDMQGKHVEDIIRSIFKI